jgi:hypothetical protein
MSLKARQELVAAIAVRYQQATKPEKQRILDEFVAATGYHRKYAINVLRDYHPIESAPAKQKRQAKPRYYTVEVQTALVEVWEATNRICSKRLVPFLPVMVETLERHGHLSISAEVKERLLAISPATVDRLLASTRHLNDPHGLATSKPGLLLKQHIPIRTFSEWDDQRPGFVEADLVAHCGDNVGGSYLNTLTMVDVATGWTECMALLFRDQEIVLPAIQQAAQQLPFPLLGLDTDNGSEFLNYALFNYCCRQSIMFTRSRPYKKNDQCHVEQKNGAIVRKFIGYDRFEGVAPCRLLTELYCHLRLYINFYQPCLKLVEKKRLGSRVTRKYDQAQTPYQRVLAATSIPDEVKQQLQEQFVTLDPISLLTTISQLQDQLWQHAYIKREVIIQPMSPTASWPVQSQSQPSSNGKSDQTNSRLNLNGNTPNGMAKATGSNTHPAARIYRRTKPARRPVTSKRWWRTRADPFAEVWPAVAPQLEQNPYIDAKVLFKAVQAQYPDRFPDNQLRTFQRRVKAWRIAASSCKIELEQESTTLVAVGTSLSFG